MVVNLQKNPKTYFGSIILNDSMQTQILGS